MKNKNKNLTWQENRGTKYKNCKEGHRIAQLRRENPQIEVKTRSITLTYTNRPEKS